MKKRLVAWFYFTFIAGLFPLIFISFTQIIFYKKITYSDICSEIFFFNIILLADSLKTLYDLKTNEKLKLMLYSTTICFLIFVSIFYGIMLMYNYIKNININIVWIYNTSVVITIFCLITCASIQVLGGAENG